MVDESTLSNDAISHISDFVTESMIGPFVAFAVICENAFADKTESTSLIRIIDKFWLEDRPLPAAIQFNMAIGMREIPASDTGIHEIHIIVFQEADGRAVLRTSLTIESEGGDINLLTQVNLFPVEEFGAYRLAAVWQGRQLSATRFEVVPGAPGQLSD